jgi:hypothetical protein
VQLANPDATNVCSAKEERQIATTQFISAGCQYIVTIRIALIQSIKILPPTEA